MDFLESVRSLVKYRLCNMNCVIYVQLFVILKTLDSSWRAYLQTGSGAILLQRRRIRRERLEGHSNAERQRQAAGPDEGWTVWPGIQVRISLDRSVHNSSDLS